MSKSNSNPGFQTGSKAALVKAHEAAIEALDLLTESPDDISHIHFTRIEGEPVAKITRYGAAGTLGKTYHVPAAAPKGFDLVKSEREPGALVLAGADEMKRLGQSDWVQDARAAIEESAKSLSELPGKTPLKAVNPNFVTGVAFAVIAGVGIGAAVRAHHIKNERERRAMAESKTPFAGI